MEIAIHLRILIGFLCFSLVGIIIELIRQDRLGATVAFQMSGQYVKRGETAFRFELEVQGQFE